VHAIANSDFLVFTSVRDSSCPAVLEAASFGVPTLGLRINGLEDFFPNTFVLGPTKLVDNRSFASEIAEQLVQFLKSDGWNSCHDNAVIFAESHLWTIKASRLIEMVISK
jgi:glycosyltransferase involved in cell wall biosynthesis